VVPAISVPTYDVNAWVTFANCSDQKYIVVDTQFFSELIWTGAIIDAPLGLKTRMVALLCFALVAARPSLWAAIPLSHIVDRGVWLGRSERTEAPGVFRYRGGVAGLIATRFVLAHEYAHVTCGHLHSEAQQKILGNNISIATFQQRQEHEADSHAIHALSSLPLIDYSAILVATDIFFRFNMLVETILDSPIHKTHMSSHPPAAERRSSTLKYGFLIFNQKIAEEHDVRVKELAATSVNNIESSHTHELWDNALDGARVLGHCFRIDADGTVNAVREFCADVANQRHENPPLAFIGRLAQIGHLL
jgi:hypothetical protein